MQNTSTVKDYISLLKPGVMLLIIFTGISGIFLTENYQHPYLSIIVILSIALASGGSAAINMWYDVDIDKIMNRTQKRTLPTGKIKPSDALSLGITLCIIASLLMLAASNLLATSLLIFAIFFYVFIYTIWLKRRTPQNIVIGGAAGAFPPLISYVSITNHISLESLALFMIIFLWTPPHFWALALYRNNDYKKANIPMLPVIKGISYTVKNIIAYTILLIISTYLILPVSSKLGYIYFFITTISNFYFLYLATKLIKDPSEKHSMSLFKYSILYLFLIFLSVIIDSLV